MESNDNNDGIAIVGIACKFPGANDANEFWENLCAKRESITFFSREELEEVGTPKELLDDPNFVPASPTLNGVRLFDASFFGYTGSEATLMDPQQRLFHEIAWQAFEDAGYQPGAHLGRVGVIAGSGGVVTSYLSAHQGDAPELLGPTGSLQHIGNDKDFVSTRISHKLDLTGPSINVQTACSTSLVAIHLACRSLLDGESDMMLVGASTVRCPHEAGYRYRSEDILSPDGHCRAFDDSAQGTIFGSGVAAVLLKPVRAAMADGDHIYAVIKGSAVNNDGAAKMSYGASSVPGQSTAMVEALSVAGVDPDTIDYVECHATGTTVGDPLEVQALTRAFRLSTTRKGFCGIGSVKTNIGHLEQTAGMAGLIKTALALRHATIPATINFNKANPKLNIGSSPFYIQQETQPWQQTPGRPRRAGVNGLGLGGTNAFLVLEEAPVRVARKAAGGSTRPEVLALSGKTPEAVRARARDLARFVSSKSDAELSDICYTSNVSRAWAPHRATVAAQSRGELIERLSALAESDDSELPPANGPRPLVFLFTGQGAQYFGMSQELYRTHVAFRETIDECERIAAPFLPRRLTDVLYFGSDRELINNTAYTQVALVAVEVALARLWMSWGVEPDAVMGHSVGEIAAACVAGALDLEGAITLAVHRGRLMASLPDTGGMAAIFAPKEVVQDLIAGYGEQLGIAGSNAPNNTVISGELAAVDAALMLANERGFSGRRLVVSHGFHSSQMDPILNELAVIASQIPFRPPVLKLVSNLTGNQLVEAKSSEYWRRHARQAVLFTEGMNLLLEQGYTSFLEIGPGTTLSSLSRQCAGELPVRCLPSLSPKRSDWGVLLESLGELYKSGHDVSWRSLASTTTPERVSLPGYPFERKPYWIGSTTRAKSAVGSIHQLVGSKLNSALASEQYQVRYSLEQSPFFDDHRIFGLVVLPTTAALEALSGMARHVFDADDVVVEGFLYREALVIPEEGERLVQLTAQRAGDGELSFSIASCVDRPGAPWIQHVEATVTRIAKKVGHLGQAWSVASTRERCRLSIPVERYYPAIRALGFEYGPGFRGIQELWQGDGEALSRVSLPEHVSSEGFRVHPAFLDACLHLYPALADVYGDFTTPPDDASRSFLPLRLNKFEYWGPANERELWVHAQRRSQDANTLVVDLKMYDSSETLVGQMYGLELRRIGVDDMRPSLELEAPVPVAEVYSREWEVASPLSDVSKSDADVHDNWLIFADAGGIGDALASALRKAGESCVVVREDAFNGATDDRAFHMISRDFFGVPGAAFKNVVYLWSLGASRASQGGFNAGQAANALSLAQSLAVVNSVTGAAPRLWLVSRDVFSETGEVEGALTGAVLWGLGASLATEYPELWGGIIDLQTSVDLGVVEQAGLLLREMWRSDGEDYVILGENERRVPRIVRPESPRDRASILPLEAPRDCLVMGFDADLAATLTHVLVTKHGAKRVTIASNESSLAATKAVQNAKRAGARIDVVECDVKDAESVQRVLGELLATGSCDVYYRMPRAPSEPLELIKPSQFRDIVNGHVSTLGHIVQRATAGEVQRLVVVSSVASWIGGTGNVADAACGAAAEALVRAARSSGVAATLVHDSLRADSADQAKRTGVVTPSNGDTLARLATVLAGDATATAIVAMNWDRWVKQYKNGVPALYSRLGRSLAKKRRNLERVEDPRLALKRIQAAPEAMRRNVIVEVVVGQVAAVLGVSVSEVNVETPLSDFGLDSLISVNLVNRLEPALGVSVPVAQLLQGATIAGLVDVLFPTLSQQTTKAA